MFVWVKQAAKMFFLIEFKKKYFVYAISSQICN